MTALRTPHTAVAGGTWVFALAALLALPLLEAAEPGSAVDVAPVGTRGWWLVVASLSVQAVALLWARRAPRAALLVVSVMPLLAAIAVDETTFSVTRIPVAVAVFVAGLVKGLRELRLTLTGAAALIAAGEVINKTAVEHTGVVNALVQAALQALSIVIVPLLLALLFAARREAREAHRSELRAVERERDALVLAAVAKERAGMARELHDIAAHHLSSIALMAAAVDRQIDTDPEAARRSVRQVRTQSRAVLDDLRRLVGLLRDDTGAERSVETLATVSSLVQDRRAVDTPTEMRTLTAESGRPLGEGIGPLAQLVAYRMVQESLTNATAHAAGAPCSVEIDDRDSAALTVTVTNEPAPSNGSQNAAPAGSGGYGLIGMRERAGLVGAELRYGPTDDGGWAVVLTIPRGDRQDGAIHPPAETEATG